MTEETTAIILLLRDMLWNNIARNRHIHDFMQEIDNCKPMKNKYILPVKRVYDLYQSKYPNVDESGYRKHNAEFLLNVSTIDIYSKKYFIPAYKKKEAIFQAVQF